jgi:Poly(ADP-ribose) polymerase and DNA-Ligase Zn-finger region
MPRPSPHQPESETNDDSDLSNKWLCNYAPNGQSICKDTHCLYNSKKIDKDDLRIGRKYPSPFQAGEIAVNWFHAMCMFSQQQRARKTTKVITTPDDIDGFYSLRLEDQDEIKEYIRASVENTFSANKLSKNRQKENQPPGNSSTEQNGNPLKKLKSVGEGRRDNGRILML